MTSQIRPAIATLALFTLITGLLYPLAVTAVAQVAFPRRANGSLVLRDGRPVGSELVGQPFEDPGYVWGRLSATGPHPYNAGASSGSNLGPMNDALLAAVQARVDALHAADPGNADPIPVDLVTASGSGLDPHISPAAAAYQVPRVARARGLSEEDVRMLVSEHTTPRTFGLLGEPRVNVLLLNLALDEIGRGTSTDLAVPVAGELVGDRLVAGDGDTVGEVVDALVGTSSGQVEYVVVEIAPGGRRTIMEDPAGRFLAVPWPLVAPGRNAGELRAGADLAALLAAPRLSEPPDPQVRGWDRALRDYWRTLGTPSPAP